MVTPQFLPLSSPLTPSPALQVGCARCIAMVLVWNELAGGDNEYCAAIVALNALLTIVLYPPFSLFYLLTLPKAIFGTSGPTLLSALRNRNASNRNASRNRPSSPGPQPQTPCLPPSPPWPHSPPSLFLPSVCRRWCAGGRDGVPDCCECGHLPGCAPGRRCPHLGRLHQD